MKTYIAFLRGINVGGHRQIKMDALKQVHITLGHASVQTYLQTGNVIFQCSTDPEKLIEKLESSYAEAFGFHTDVMLRTPEDLQDVIQNCPFTEAVEPKYLHIVLLSEKPSESAGETLLKYDGAEHLELINDTLYVYYTNGSGRSKLNLRWIEKVLEVKGTARNWNTIVKLAEIAETLS
jgi:uncharacterized protein (DUF1697 family)